MEVSGKLHILNNLSLGKEPQYLIKRTLSVSSSEVISASGEEEKDRQYV
jgi:hypothetical protein